LRLSIKNPSSQRAVLRELAGLAYRSIPAPQIQEAAKLLTSRDVCDDRDDRCELEQIYNAVKYGDDRVPWLAKGIRYVADPRSVDFFTAPKRLAEMCERGACGGDCDDQAAMVAALAGALGFKVGLRAWGPGSNPHGELTHVYAVVGFPKRDPVEVLGLDTTVEEAYVGWEPDSGHVVTAWVED
jgi:hypothetical protein